MLGSIRSIFGESACWDPLSDCLWWVDLHGHMICCAQADGRSRAWKTPGPHLPLARALVVREKGGVLVALGADLAVFHPTSGQFTKLPLALQLPPGHVFNDATVDIAGRLIIGTMLPGRGDDGKAAIFQVSEDLSVQCLFDDLNTTNGLAFSPDGATMYHSDSHPTVQTVWATPYDVSSGDIDTSQPLIDFAELPGRPDGAAVDQSGGYWSAAIGSPYLHRFGPDGRLDLSLALPVDTPTRPAFGGSDLSVLFCTTAGLKNGEIDGGVKGGVLEMASPYRGNAVALTLV